MPAELAVIIPTRGRPENIRKVISAWDFTNAWDVADMVLAVDVDDPEYQGYVDLYEEHRHPDTGEQLFSVHYQDRWVPMVHKLDETARLLAPAYFAVGFAGDDHLPQTIGWAQTYLAALHELETGLVHSDDGYQHANICTEWAVTSDVIQTLGRMIPAPVEHMYSDVSLHELMTEAGALRYLPQVRIEHMHPIVGKAENDGQYRRVNSREQFRQDKIKYDGWRNGRKSEDLAAVKALRPDRPPVTQAARAARQRPAWGTRGTVKRSGPSHERTSMSRFPFSREFKHVRGATPDEIGMTLADFALRVPADQEIVELGVFQGRTALIMAWGAKQGHGAHVTGIDAWDLEGNTYGPPFNQADSENWARYRITELGYADRITLVKNFASDAAASWPRQEDTHDEVKPIGLLFIDDDHSYAGARRAVEDWAPHLAEGATIAVDDYGHPDWPGVKEAVDDLVDEGVLEPIEIYHEHLAVTRLKAGAPDRRNGGKPLADPACSEEGHDHSGSSCRGIKAITSEGVSPSPYPAAEGQVADSQVANLDDSVSGQDPAIRMIVQEDELVDVDAGTPVTDLNTVQLRALAKARGITLGVRKDKRSEMLAAIEAGE